MNKRVLASLGLFALTGAHAFAADMQLKAVAVRPFSWTGRYIGGSFGSMFSATSWTMSGAVASDQEPTGLTAGGQAGCNYQISNWVFGVQGDYAWTEASSTAVDQVSLLGLTDEAKLNAISSVTGRLGYALDRWLGYAKGGGAMVRENYDTFFTGTNTTFSTGSQTRSGWTAGVGLEDAMVSNLSIFAEYDWYDFGTRQSSFAIVGGGIQNISMRERDSVFKAGVNWAFR
jgi:outer membrane immunogenic protein